MPNVDAHISEGAQGSYGPCAVPLYMWPRQDLPQGLPKFKLEREEGAVQAIRRDGGMSQAVRWSSQLPCILPTAQRPDLE